VAHDFNNKLSVILGYAELAKKGNVAPEKTQTYLNQIIEAAIQSREITRQCSPFPERRKITPGARSQ